MDLQQYVYWCLYHSPKPLYQTETLLNQLELNFEQIGLEFPAATVVLCGDFNQLSDEIMCERTGLLSIVKQPTRHQRILDRIYVSKPIYSVIRIVTSLVRSDHNAVIAYTDVERHLNMQLFYSMLPV